MINLARRFSYSLILNLSFFFVFCFTLDSPTFIFHSQDKNNLKMNAFLDFFLLIFKTTNFHPSYTVTHSTILRCSICFYSSKRTLNSIMIFSLMLFIVVQLWLSLVFHFHCPTHSQLSTFNLPLPLSLSTFTVY